jgi:hypothetical protein
VLAPTTGTRRQPKISPIATFSPLPWQITPWRDKSRVLLLTGSAGGGKSRLAAEKLHGFCLRYPGAFALIARKTRVSMTKGTVLFLKETVIGADPSVAHLESKDYFRYRAHPGLPGPGCRPRASCMMSGSTAIQGREAKTSAAM